MKRKYFTELNCGQRIDLFLEGGFRIVTNLQQINDQDCQVLIQNYETVQAKLRKLKSEKALKGIYYNQDEVFGFETELKSHLSLSKKLVIDRPSDFFKVKRRQHVRVNWFAKVDYLEVEQLMDYKIGRRGQVATNNELMTFSQSGYMLNLSGGGLELKTPKPIQSQYVICRFKAKGEYQTYKAIKRRVQEIDELGVTYYKTGLEFVHLTEDVRERTIRLVFEKMREIGRKRLG